MLAGILAGLAAGALWGLVFVAPRMVGGFSGADLTASRFMAFGLAAALVMWLRAHRAARPTRAQAGAAMGLSVLGFTGYYLLAVWAIRDAGSEMPALIVGTIPVWLMLLGKPAGLRWAALWPGLVLTAVALVLMAKASGAAHDHAGPATAAHASHYSHYLRGMALAVLATGSWTAFALLNAAWLRRHPEVKAADWANWLGVAAGLGGLVLALALGSPWRDMAAQPQLPLFLAVVVATGVGAGWLATLLWNVASQRLPASLCGQLIVSETLFALLYSFMWDGRWPSLWQWLAAALFTAGILASIKAHE